MSNTTPIFRKEKTLAIIPARGGSKRIPRKNILDFYGQPILAYAIQAALQSGSFDEVMVSTDDEEIASIAKQYGANVPFMRKAENAGDMATTADVLIEVLDAYASLGQTFAHACCIYPVNPFVNGDKLSQGYTALVESGASCVFTAVRYGHPVQRSFQLQNDKVQLLFPQYVNTRTQDLPPIYHDAAQFYWFSADALRQTNKLISADAQILEIPETEAQDIDTPTDWELAKIKFEKWQEKQK